jgi:Xaa-Pro aminopeptidase
MIYNIERLQHVLARQELDCLIASTKENILYFSGFDPVIKTLNSYYGQCYIVITANQPDKINVVHSIGEVDQLLDALSSIELVNTYGRFFREYEAGVALYPEELKLQAWSDLDKAFPSAELALADLLKKLVHKKKIRIGYDQDGMPAATLACLQCEIGNATFSPASALIRHVRMVKTAYESEKLKTSAIINERAINDVVRQIQKGGSEVDLARMFDTGLVQRGAQPALTMIKIGRAAVGGQRRQQEQIKLSSGDLIWFDSDARYKGYWSDIARVVAFKEPSPICMALYDALTIGMKTAASQIEAGMTGADVFHLVMAAVHGAGFPGYRRHHVGHGIGVEPYELPILSPTDTNTIENGMILSIETPYYQFGMGALHIEDPILISANGNCLLTEESIPPLHIIN